MEDLEFKEYKNNHKTSFLASEYEKLLNDVGDLEKISDVSMADMVKDEGNSFRKRMDDLEDQMKKIVSDDKEQEKIPREIILEIRAGAGGDEASIFARDLAVMYETYAASKRWSVKKINESVNGIGGYKEVSMELSGEGVYDYLKYETGVHRIQRVPVTEKSGRVHTSTASVAIMPIRKIVDVVIDPADIKIEFSRSGGAGGMNVNKVETAVRIVHTPSGLEVRCTAERTQQKNREKAMQILSSRLQTMKEEEESKQYASIRKNQIGTGDRSEKIRTYNVLQDRITDHRIKKSWHGYEKIMAGNIDPILESIKEYAEEL